MREQKDHLTPQTSFVNGFLAWRNNADSEFCPGLSSGAVATKEVNGWPDQVFAPSAVPYSEELPFPKEMTIDDIENVKKAFVASVKRAVACGFDVIEIHCAQ